MSKKNIWYISKYAVTKNYGNPTRQYFLSKYIAREGFDVTLFSSKSSGIKTAEIKGIGKKREIDGFTHIFLNGPIINLGFSIKRIYSWIVFETLLFISPLFLKPRKPDVIIVSSLSLLTVITGYLFKKIYGAKLIFEIRDIWPLSLMELKKTSSKNPFIFFLRQIEKFGYKKAEHIVGTMPKLDEHIKTTIKKNFNFTCIPMGYDPDFYSNLKELPQNIKEKIPKDKFIVAYAGAIGIVNQVEKIVDIAKQLEKTNPKIFFAILGDGPLKEKLLNQAKGLKNIVFLEKIGKEYVNDFLTKCDLLLHLVKDNRIYKFGVSPNKWIDYMYSARPIIVAYNGYKSIINEAECGEFIDSNNTKLLIEKIIEYSKKDTETLNKIGAKGKKFLEKNLTYSALSKKYITIFNSLNV